MTCPMTHLLHNCMLICMYAHAITSTPAHTHSVNLHTIAPIMASIHLQDEFEEEEEEEDLEREGILGRKLAFH